MVLAAAMVTPGGDIARVQGPAIHPAAEITPNAMPRLAPAHPDDQPSVHDGAQLTHAGGDLATVDDGVSVGADTLVTAAPTTGRTLTPSAPALTGESRAPPAHDAI